MIRARRGAGRHALAPALLGALALAAGCSSTPNGAGSGTEALSKQDLVAISFVSPERGFGIAEPQATNGTTIPLELDSTTDGGRRWRSVGPLPGTESAGGKPLMVFTDDRTGFLRGPRGLYVTHDGGRTWALQALAGRVLDLAVAGGRVWVALSTCPAEPEGAAVKQPCSVEAAASDDDGDSFQPLTDLPFAQYEGGQVVAPSKHTAYIATWRPAGTASGSGELLATDDGGTAWRSLQLPCPAAYQLGGALSLGGNTLWLACLGQGSGGAEGKVLYRSTDGGAGWAAVSSYAVGGATGAPGGAPSGTLEGLEATSPSDAVLLTVNGGLARTVDGGSTWSPAVPDVAGYDGVLAFADPRHGWLAAYTVFSSVPGVWRTTDGSASWRSSAA
jgi:photosystem II stability/assembly factor-like uncharacterized protein